MSRYLGRDLTTRENNRLKVAIVSCVFPPEPVTSAVTSQHLAEYLAQQGHAVTVVAPVPTRPSGRRDPRFRRFRLVQCERTNEGFEVRRVFSFVSRRPRLLSRFAENLSFGLSSAASILRSDAQVVYANTWPVIAGALIAWVCKARNVPLILSIQDVHPEAAINLGKLSEKGTLARILRWCDNWLVNQAREIVVPSARLRDLYRKKRRIRPSIHVVPNWVDATEVVPGRGRTDGRHRLGAAEDDFVVTYGGNVGALADIGCVLECASLLRDHPKVTFAIAGDGSARDYWQQKANEQRLTNVRFIYPISKADFPSIQAASDLFVLPTRGESALTSVPSKLVGYMMSGRAVLACVSPESESAAIILESESGLCFAPGDSVGLANAILMLKADGPRRQRMGEKARQFALRFYSRDVCLPRLSEIVLAGQH